MGFDMLCDGLYHGITNKQKVILGFRFDKLTIKKSPALGFFYAGLARAKNALSLMYLTVLSVAVVSFQVNTMPYHLFFFFFCMLNFVFELVVLDWLFIDFFQNRVCFYW